ncbi:hypothetical protein JG688_00016240 [Phytophthora aleatoria]|uniref:Uncharacterized protein n=1 Tax=Phytophthora aleatoria TaxID=2496075 RepID=A0A8J5LZ31_9STRA|nr:hypothetical protein JG688_00016240 [Phytophthora aleatoria]
MLKMLGSETGRPAVTIRRDKDPVTEWDRNGELIGGALPCLFMRGGKELPNDKLGPLANSVGFRSILQKAKQEPGSPQAKRANGYLLWVIPLIGGCAPFSPFERATTRPKLSAMRARYGVPQHWSTVAEHHSLKLHHIALLRRSGGWNQTQ